MELAKYVNAKQIQQLFRDNGIRIGYTKARSIKESLINSHKNVAVPDKRVVPLVWVEEEYGISAPKGKRIKKDAPQPAK